MWPTICQVRAAAHLVHACQNLDRTVGLGTYQQDNTLLRVQACDTRAAIQRGAVGDGLQARGYDLSRLGSHSLRSGGATHLKLVGYDDAMIKKLGRWSSNTYLLYIQSMIGELTARVSSAPMARPLRFFNVVRSFTLLYSSP